MVHPPKTISSWDTGVPVETLKFVGAKSCSLPDGFVRTFTLIIYLTYCSQRSCLCPIVCLSVSFCNKKFGMNFSRMVGGQRVTDKILEVTGIWMQEFITSAATLIKLLTYCVLMRTQPPPSAGREMSSSSRATGRRPALIGVVVCLCAAPRVQLFPIAGNGKPHNAPRYY